MSKIEYVNFEGLQEFKRRINEEILKSEIKSIKTVSLDSENRKINFYKKETNTSTDIPDFSITLPEYDLSGLLEKISNGVIGNIVAVDEGGTVSDSGVAISDIAKKSEIKSVDEKVGDITKLNTSEKSDVVKAINEIKNAISAGGEAGVITLETENTTTGALKSYTVKQGGITIGVIDIPKDLVVSEGSVVENPEGQPDGTYIKLVIANQETPLFINVGNLIDIYTAKKNATQIQIVIDPSTKEISATIIPGSIGTTELADNAVTTVKIADANITLAKLAIDVTNAFDSAGSASAAETNAKSYSDTLNATMSSRVKSVEDKIGDGFEAITIEEINSLFT